MEIVNPFLTNKGFIASSDISLNEENEIITTDKDLPKAFNNRYVNIIEKTAESKLYTDLHKFCDRASILLFQKLKIPKQTTLVL